jgi:hypothetical protein
MHRLVHLGLVGLGDLRDYRPIGRIYVRKFALPRHESAIDIILD